MPYTVRKFEAKISKYVFRCVVQNVLGSSEELQEKACGSGNMFNSTVLPTMAGAVFNAFVANHIKDVSSQAHGGKRKGPPSRSGNHSADSDKVRKPTGVR